MHYPRDCDVTWVKSDGTIQPNHPGTPVTLATGTYYADIGGSEATDTALQLSWDASLVATSTLETTNFPASEASTYAAASNLWFPESSTTVTIAGGSAGTNIQHLGFSGARRMRCKLVVTTQGELRARSHHKD